MLLALDVGNTNLTIGAFDDARLVAQWRLRTVHEQTADEWGILLRNLFALSGHDTAKVDGVVISSVVPPLDPSLAAMAPRYFNCEAMFVNPAKDTGLVIKVDNPSEVGADRVRAASVTARGESVDLGVGVVGAAEIRLRAGSRTRRV